MMEDIAMTLILMAAVPILVVVLIIVGIVSLLNRRNVGNPADPNESRQKMSVKDVFLNIGAFLGLYVLVGTVLNLLFSIIDAAYPKITDSYYYGSSSISWPVSILVVLFPIFIFLMWLLEQQYRADPEKQSSLIHRVFTYITLTVAGLVIVGDLVTVVYYFIDGQEITTGFFLKVSALLVIAAGLFIYFISDLRGKLTHQGRVMWRYIAGAIVLGSIVWGFTVLGSPRTQRLYRYDEQKVSHLQNIDNQVQNFYSSFGALPNSMSEIYKGDYYVPNQNDPQSGKPYEYKKTSESTYELCAEFNKATDEKSKVHTRYSYNYGGTSWTHPVGFYCFSRVITSPYYGKPFPQLPSAVY